MKEPGIDPKAAVTWRMGIVSQAVNMQEATLIAGYGAARFGHAIFCPLE